MAGTLGTPTVTNLTGARQLVAVEFTVSTSGALTGEELTLPFLGQLHHCAIKPSTGAAQPTDAFDVTLLTTDGEDLLEGQGANSTNDGVTRVRIDPRHHLEGVTLYPTIDNAGDSKTGIVRLVIGE